MKRREFILSSIMTIGGSALLTSGCKKKEVTTLQQQIIKRKFKNIDIPLLGFGCMRLPMRNGKIDIIEMEKMVEHAMAHGANYFDTAYMYVKSQSEIAIGKILKKYPRKSFFLADKCPAYLVNSKEDVQKLFKEQLKKCQVDYFDFYMVHNINKNSISNYRNNDMYGELLKLKKEGKIKYLGFSFHGDTKMLKEVINEHVWDFCQLQINYLDWEITNAKELYEIADKAKVPIIVMEPLRGGGLCKLPDKAINILKENCPNDTPASFGLRWLSAQNKSRIFLILSGMSNTQQMKENLDTFVNYREFTKEEENISSDIVKIIQQQGKINCTACKYCLEVCPRGINIPAIFNIYNNYKGNKENSFFKMYYNSLNDSEKAENCIKCGLCNKNCPQGLDIPTLLTKVEDTYKNIKGK